MRKRVLILFTACCVMLAGAAEFRWDFSRSGDGCTGRAVLPPVAAVTLKDGALETGNTSACYRLPARLCPTRCSRTTCPYILLSTRMMFCAEGIMSFT